jgi:hypothetical protein
VASSGSTRRPDPRVQPRQPAWGVPRPWQRRNWPLVSSPDTTTSEYTAPQSQTNSGASASVRTGYEVFSSTGSESFNGTFSTAMYWASGIAFFTT